LPGKSRSNEKIKTSSRNGSKKAAKVFSKFLSFHDTSNYLFLTWHEKGKKEPETFLGAGGCHNTLFVLRSKLGVFIFFQSFWERGIDRIRKEKEEKRC
jgi:hypothetical protein